MATGLLLQSGSDLFVVPVVGGGGGNASVTTMTDIEALALVDDVFGTTGGVSQRPRLGLTDDEARELANNVFD
jgi:hypothetical protein